MKIIRLKNHLTVILGDGTMLTNNKCDDTLYRDILNNQDSEDVIKSILIPEFYKKEEEINQKTKMLSDFNDSDYLTVFGNSVYIKTISELTLPEDLAVAFYKAEQEGDQELIDTYLNFWTLASLNPDSRARTNLFWFLNKYGMKISKSGLFVAYRNVQLKKEGSKITTEVASFITDNYNKIKFKWKKSPSKYFVGQNGDELFITKDREDILDIDYGTLQEAYVALSDENEAPIYTDAHSRTFTIKIGEPVTMPREACDSVQENTCSRGLHVAGREWLSSGYFGQISLMVLVNPADVVAVPPEDNYGKMRVCAYYPIQIIKRDLDGNIVESEIEDGFEDDFINIISYEGEVNNEDTNPYSINIPQIPEVSRGTIMRRLDYIKEQLKNNKDVSTI